MGKRGKDGGGGGSSPKGVLPDPVCPVTGMLLDAGLAPGPEAVAPRAVNEPRVMAAPLAGSGGGKKGGRQSGNVSGNDGEVGVPDTRKGSGKVKARKGSGSKQHATPAPVVSLVHVPQVTRVTQRPSGVQRESPPTVVSKGNYAGARFQTSPDPATLPMPMLGKKTTAPQAATAPAALDDGPLPQPVVFFANSARAVAPENVGVATDPRHSKHHVQMQGHMMMPSAGAHCHTVPSPMHGLTGVEAYAQYGTPQPGMGTPEEMTAGLKSLLGF